MRNPLYLVRALILPAGAIAAIVWSLSSYGSSMRLVAFIGLFVLAADLASLVRGAMQNALVTLAALLFGLASLEAVAFAMLPRVEILHPPGLWGSRPELGWGPQKPGRYPVAKRVDGKTIYQATYTIDGDLLRQTGVAEPGARKAGPSVAFFGDSVTFGEGLDDADTLPQAFAGLSPSLEVANLGFSAYSPSQVLRELETGMFDKRLVDARAFVLLTGPWHAERTACKPNFSVRAPRYEVIDGKLDYRGPCFTGLRQHIEEIVKETATYKAFLASVLQRPNHDDLETYIEIVDAVAKIARDRYGVPLVVLYVVPPDHYLDGTGFSNADIRSRFREAGIHLVEQALPGHSGETLTIPGDGHPTALANRLLARKLVDDLSATMPGLLKPPAKTATP